jgi:hypothetical protein
MPTAVTERPYRREEAVAPLAAPEHEFRVGDAYPG